MPTYVSVETSKCVWKTRKDTNAIQVAEFYFQTLLHNKLLSGPVKWQFTSRFKISNPDVSPLPTSYLSAYINVLEVQPQSTSM
jgi:hypothetical protein